MRVDVDELEAIRQAAKDADRRISDYVRHVLLNYIKDMPKGMKG